MQFVLPEDEVSQLHTAFRSFKDLSLLSCCNNPSNTVTVSGMHSLQQTFEP